MAGEIIRGKEEALQLVQAIPLLQIVPNIDAIVSVYAQRKLMPATNLADAYHLALASHYEVDYLLTWNCRHLANVRKQDHIAEVNRELGLMVPKLTTPEALFTESTED